MGFPLVVGSVKDVSFLLLLISLTPECWFRPAWASIPPGVQEIEAMRAYVAEQLEKEEKRKASELARERRALLALAPRRRSGRLIVSAFMCAEDVDGFSRLFKLDIP